jgi:hypothetical protein
MTDARWRVTHVSTYEEILQAMEKIKAHAPLPADVAGEAWQEFARIYLEGGIMICHPATWARLKEVADAAGFDTSHVRIREHSFMKIGDVAAVQIGSPSFHMRHVADLEPLTPREWNALMNGSWEDPTP